MDDETVDNPVVAMHKRHRSIDAHRTL